MCARRRELGIEPIVTFHHFTTPRWVAAAGVPVGLILAMPDDQLQPGGEAALAEHARDQEEPYLEAARGDDFIFIRRALESVLECLADGVDVRGHTYWSLLDSFEWALGYRPTFGLVAVDRTTQARTPKPSASWLGQVAGANALPPG